MNQPIGQTDNSAHQALRRVFGFDTFRPNQESIVRAILDGRDVVAVMPTGGGKSLCYQLPSCLLEGVCVVVSPLISLMKDQVDAARSNGLRAACYNSSLSAGERSDVARCLRNGQLDLLYVSPERFGLGGFVDLLKTVRLCLLAIDEAHCISEWGHDFRPDYLALSQLAGWFPTVPLAAFTASATFRVQKDIAERLGLRQPHIVRASFDRPNLFYQVEPKDDAESQIARFLRARKGQAAIVYRTTRDNVRQTADALCAAGISALPYHAGMEPLARQTNQDAFSRDEVDVIVATIAFGMGIDKSNVRYVIHGDLPKNVESYYQETGRAGRDGAPAQCLLLFDMADVPMLRFFITKMENPVERKAASQKLSQMIDFAQTPTCRRRHLLRYFGEDYKRENCAACDFCRGPVFIDDSSVDAQKIMSAIARTDERMEAGQIIDIVVGADSEPLRSLGCHTLKTWGVGKDKAPDHWRRVVEELLRQGHIEPDAQTATVLKTTAKGKDVLFGRRVFHLLRTAEDAAKAMSGPDADAFVPADDDALFEALRRWRRNVAREEGVPPFIVMSDRTLQEIARRKPCSIGRMSGISGIGEAKLRRYGRRLVEEVSVYCETHGGDGDSSPWDSPARPRKKASKGPQSVQTTWELLQEGLGPDEIAARRGITRSTIIGHMEALILQGRAVDISPLVSPAQRSELEAAFAAHGTGSLAKVLEASGRAFTYDQARLVRAILQRTAPPRRL